MHTTLLVGGLCFLADIVLGAFLFPWYYLHGILVVRVRRAVETGANPAPTPGALEQRLRSFFLGSIVFSDFGGLTYGFRRSLLHGSGILQCVVGFEPGEAALVVEGRIGWFFLASVGLVAVSLRPRDLSEAGLIGGVLTALTAIDVAQCLRVASAARQLWESSEEHPAA